MARFDKVRRLGATIVLSTALMGGSLAVVAPEAKALGGYCSAWLENGVGYTRGVGRCSSLHRDTKARVTLDLQRAPDRHSGWFVTVNKTYRTPSWTSYSPGWPRAARVDHARR